MTQYAVPRSAIPAPAITGYPAFAGVTALRFPRSKTCEAFCLLRFAATGRMLAASLAKTSRERA